MEKSKAFNLENYVGYSKGSIVSKTLIDKKSGTLTLFAFDKGQGLSEHIAPFDAVVYMLDGEAKLNIGDKSIIASKGDVAVMPANIPHSVEAENAFKMLLVMIREEGK